MERMFSRELAAVVSAYLLIVVMMAGTLPTPLYSLYAQQLGLSPLWITMVFAMYALAILAALLLFGRLSDSLGRLPVIAISLGLTLLCLLTFIFRPTLSGLFVARAFSGLAVGLLVGTTTAYLAELLDNRSRAALISSVSNMAGLGLGALMAGALAQYGSAPLRDGYQCLLLMLLPSLLLPWMPETVSPTAHGTWLRIQRLQVPQSIRPAFMAAALAVFCGFSFLGLFAALAGRFLLVGLHHSGFLLSGAVVFSAFCSAAGSQCLVARRAPRRVVSYGVLALPLALLGVWRAFALASLSLFLFSAVLGGIGAGMVLRGGLGLVTSLAPTDRLAEVCSCLFVAAYLGLILPVVGMGLLLVYVGLPLAILLFCAAVSILAGLSRNAMSNLECAPLMREARALRE